MNNMRSNTINVSRLLIMLWMCMLMSCSRQDTSERITHIENQDVLLQENTQGLSPATLPPLPDNLHWETNNDDPVFADPAATRGGTFREFIDTFPLTLRLVGPDSNGSFAGLMRSLNLSLVQRHPNTGNPLPALATHWAYGADNKTVYFKLDPDARWSDGRKVTADDYLFMLRFMRSKFIVAPWYNEYFTNKIREVIKYDDYTIAVVAGSPKPHDELLFEYANISPSPRQFYRLDENWVRHYNWKVEPGTAAYTVSDMRKGKWVKFHRVDNWWGTDKKYYRHRFNIENVHVKVIRDMNTAWRYFLKGELDTFSLTLPQLWHDKATGADFDHGYIHKIKFYNDVPQPAQGIWFNLDNTLLANRDIRLGIAYSMNLQKVIDTVLRGDYERLETQNVGYGDYTNKNIKPRTFDLQKAADYFAKAGFTQRDKEGILINNGQRLSFEVAYGRPEHTDRLVVLKEEARKAGVDLQLKLLDGSAFFKQVQEKKHQIAWLGWSGGGISPTYREFYHSENAHVTQTNNITNYADAEMDKLIEQYEQEVAKPERITLAHTIEQKIYDSGAMIPTFKVPYTRAAYWAWIKLPVTHGTRESVAIADPMGEGLLWIDTNAKAQLRDDRTHGKVYPAQTILDTTWRTAHE